MNLQQEDFHLKRTEGLSSLQQRHTGKNTVSSLHPLTDRFPSKNSSAVAMVELWCDPNAVLQKVNSFHYSLG